jgi:hypothetical protein
MDRPRLVKSTGGCRCPLEADEPADERVVPGVSGVAVPLAQEEIEPMLGVWERRLDAEAEMPESRCADRNEQRLDRLDAGGQVLQALLDELATRQSLA